MVCVYLSVFFFKQKTAYEMRISDWSSDVCSSDLEADADRRTRGPVEPLRLEGLRAEATGVGDVADQAPDRVGSCCHVDRHRVVHAARYIGLESSGIASAIRAATAAAWASSS